VNVDLPTSEIKNVTCVCAQGAVNPHRKEQHHIFSGEQKTSVVTG